jgi:integrase
VAVAGAGEADLAHAESSPDCVFGNLTSGEISSRCPSCSSPKVWRDGVRCNATKRSAVQRWLCRDCGLRFSESKALKSEPGIVGNAKYASSETKNLVTVTETKTVAGDRKRKPKQIDLLPEDVRGLLTKFMAYLEREGYNVDTTYPWILTHLAKDGADLLDPENVKTVIAQQRKPSGEPWSDSMKLIATCAYDSFCLMQGITWKRPAYYQNEATIMVPDEKDLDLLISAASRRMAAFLLCLKETFADPTEILRADWIDLKDNVFSINHPVKYHYPGKYELSRQLTCMLNALPREHKRIFPMTYKCAYVCLEGLRRKAATYFQNPALLQITFKSFRHWGGSMLAHITNGNVPVMARILRHKSWKSTQKYVHTIEFKETDYEETIASTPEEIRALGKAGWTKYDELTVAGAAMHFYRKPKRFGSLRNMDDTRSSFDG